MALHRKPAFVSKYCIVFALSGTRLITFTLKKHCKTSWISSLVTNSHWCKKQSYIKDLDGHAVLKSCKRMYK